MWEVLKWGSHWPTPLHPQKPYWFDFFVCAQRIQMVHTLVSVCRYAAVVSCGRFLCNPTRPPWGTETVFGFANVSSHCHCLTMQYAPLNVRPRKWMNQLLHLTGNPTGETAVRNKRVSFRIPSKCSVKLLQNSAICCMLHRTCEIERPQD